MPRKVHHRIAAHHKLVKASKSYAEYTKKAPEQGFGVRSRAEFDRIRVPRLRPRRKRVTDEALNELITRSDDAAKDLHYYIENVEQDHLIRDIDWALRVQRRIGRMLEKVKKELQRRKK